MAQASRKRWRPDPTDALIVTPECTVTGCPHPPDERFPTVPLCTAHASAVVRDYQRAAETVTVPEVPVRTSPTNVRYPSLEQVYYLTVAPGVVKIGYSRYLVDRIGQIRRTLTDLLATEPGSRELEQKRHAEYDDARVLPRREDFRLTPDLMAHIDLCRRLYDTHLTRRGGPIENVSIIARCS